MPYYTIHHDVKNQENLEKLIESLVAISTNHWARISSQLTIIHSDCSATQLIEHLYQHVDKSDMVFLSESNLSNWASIGLPDEINGWIFKS